MMPSALPDLRQERTDLAMAVSHEDAVANLLLCWRKQGGGYRVCRVQTDDSLSSDFLEMAREQAADLADERMRVSYDPEWPLKEHEFFGLDNDPPVGDDLFELLGNYVNLPQFSRKNLTKPRLYVVAVSSPDGLAFFGKRTGQSLTVLGRSRKGLVSTVFDGSTFTSLDASVVTFSTRFDWVSWPSTERIYVLDGKEFHNEFRDVPELMAAVAAGVETIRSHVEIVDYAKLVTRCQKNVQMASKLNHVVEHGIYRWPVDELKAYAQQYEINVTWDDEDLVFDDSLEGQWAILKLLDEDRTEGPVTGRHYESSAKQQVS
jgi:Domain of unknown function (DUF4868)